MSRTTPLPIASSKSPALRASLRRPTSRRRPALLLATILILLGLPASFQRPAWAQGTGTAGVTPAAVRPAAARGTTVVPDRFLRRWDPVTIFFDRDAGPAAAAGGPIPEDHPEGVLSLDPAHPGAFTWLDRRTLQFRPGEPWPPLARFTWTVGGEPFRLATLMEPPISTSPADGAEGLERVESVALTFTEPLDPRDLARAVTLELRPLPGVGEGGSRWLEDEDFEVKVLDRSSRSDPASYVLNLDSPIPAGTRVVVHLRLSLEEAEDSFAEIAFGTAEPFRPLALGCRRNRYPVAHEGSRYSAEQAIRCDPRDHTLVVELSGAPRPVGPVEGRNLVRLTPAAANLEYRVAGKTLEVEGDFARDTLYRVTLAPSPAPITDLRGRPLEMAGESEVHVYFPRESPFLRWQAAGGVAERLGPRRVPVEGRGEERLDLRIQRLDPLDRSFWPFPEQPVVTEEGRRPPGPGEEPAPFTDPGGQVDAQGIAERIRNLGSPPVSTLVELPLRRQGGPAHFGLDLAEHLDALSGTGAPGTYLVGLRRLSDPEHRSWMRLQVTDLALTTVEEPERVVFAVTSLAGGRPVSGARVRLEGTVRHNGRTSWETVFEDVTDGEGRLVWRVPGTGRQARVRRLTVSKGDDLLLLDPSRPPDAYADNHWSESRETWLQWTQGRLAGRGPQPQALGHLFTERPVYRPEEPVHLRGYLRRREAGHLTPIRSPGLLVISGPGDLEWRYEITPGEAGAFYHRFEEEKLPTGVYTAFFQIESTGERLGSVSFRKEAYRLPRFEVQLHGPDRAALDRELQVDLTATYYAGGRVAGRPVDWRVTQFPHTWTPEARPGFYWSSDGRFSTTGRFESTPTLERRDVTDEDGGASLLVDPTVEPTAQPRTYVIEATVTGADDQTVTATRRVVTLPPFLLGLAVPRYLERAETATPRVLVLGPDGQPRAGQEVTVRLLQRQWHSHLRASDFSDGVARYVTEVVDEKIAETTLTSGPEAVPVELALAGAGVYIVELEARDRLGRAQVVAVDLFAGGDRAVSWDKPATAVFEVAADQPSYRPGDTARLVLESPFQQALALAVVEAPEGNRYRWLPVEGGQAVLEVPVLGTWAPRLPVHFLLLRGRVAGTEPPPGNRTDLGKPATLGATAWLTVEPVDHRLEVELDYPKRALPGVEIEVGVTLSDPQGRPLPGEVTLWLVDQAVLALGREQRLDPLPDFLPPVTSHLVARDTRGLVFGALPTAPAPGGGEGEEPRGLLDRQTVRKTFSPVPYYQPAIAVGPSGKTRVTVKLPDNLTNFELRAKAIHPPERFGFATGHLEVRLPVIVQPALPRFVRAGDRFVASAVGRLVEGEGGPGRAEGRFEGVELEGEATRELTWVPDRPRRLDFPVVVPSPAYGPAGHLERQEVVFRVGVERLSDGAGDAFEVRLPLLPDRDPEIRRLLAELVPGQPLELPQAQGPVRPGSFRRTVLVSGRPELVAMAAGLDFLLAYPHGCTEQRLSRARAQLALRKLRDLLHQEGDDAALDRAVNDTLAWIPQVTGDDDLAAYWPDSRRYVSLTAWVVEFLVEAKEAGYPVDGELLRRLTGALERALRSDYSGFIDGESWAERTWALRALAAAGRFDAAYAAELARRSRHLDLDSVAGVLLAFDRGGRASSPAVPGLVEELLEALVVRLWQGREILGGLQWRHGARNGLILPGETRTLADITRALARLGTEEKHLDLLVEGLVNRGRGDGWGSTAANAAALLALAELFQPPLEGVGRRRVELALPDGEETLVLEEGSPTGYRVSLVPGPAAATLVPGGAEEPVAVRSEIRYLPAEDGSRVTPRRQGFVVTRELLRVGEEGVAPERVDLGEGGETVELSVGEVIEDHVEVVNPADRHYVAVVVPLAAGMEPLNPHLATAPPEARPRGRLTREPSYVAFLDHRVAFYYDELPKGTYDFWFRTRATVPGSFTQPAARAELMYDAAVVGGSAGARVVVAREEGE